VNEFFRLHALRWEGGSQALTDLTEPFHRALAEASLRQGWLRLNLLEVEGKIIAAEYGWRIGDRQLAYLSGYDAEWSSLGPGASLLVHSIEEAAAEGVHVYDLMRGDEDYKRRLATGSLERESYLVTRRRHPVGTAIRTSERLVATGRTLPEGLRRPARSVYRAVQARR
jgi:CelD/BcsL family acetyltransferase involved in cellulose biosynthesis